MNLYADWIKNFKPISVLKVFAIGPSFLKLYLHFSTSLHKDKLRFGKSGDSQSVITNQVSSFE